MDRLINETDTVVLLPAHEVLGTPNAILPTGLVAYDALTAAAINHYAVVTSRSHANAGGGGNISSALVEDAFTLNLTDSNEDDEKSLTDAANSVDLTDLNFDADFTGFRDADKNATDSVYVLFSDLTFGPDVPYLVIHRVGFASDVPFAAGQEIDVYYVWTDVQLALHEDGAKQKIQSAFVPKSVAKVSYVLGA